MSELTVRTAKPTDLASVRAVAQSAWRATYTGHIPEIDIDLFLTSNYSLDALAAACERLGPGMLVVELDGRVCGYVMVGRNREGACELFAIYVLPSEQGRGAGHALWNAAVAHARTLGCEELELWVLADNDGARRFYERQGAREAETRPYPIGAYSITELRYALPL
jgi:ribosomal protein S18 acetylase RimI-like enzyme